MISVTICLDAVIFEHLLCEDLCFWRDYGQFFPYIYVWHDWSTLCTGHHTLFVMVCDISPISPHLISNRTKANIEDTFEQIMSIDGAIRAALVDCKSGMTLGTIGGNRVDMEVARAGPTEVVRAENEIIDQLCLNHHIEDILITLPSQHHLDRVFRRNDNVFTYSVLVAETNNLALAKMQLGEIEKEFGLGYADNTTPKAMGRRNHRGSRTRTIRAVKPIVRPTAVDSRLFDGDSASEADTIGAFFLSAVCLGNAFRSSEGMVDAGSDRRNINVSVMGRTLRRRR